jgi:hypothetical protein
MRLARGAVVALAFAFAVDALACGSRTGLTADLLVAGDAAILPGVDASGADVVKPACGFASPTQLADVAFTTGGFSALTEISALTPAGGTLFIGAWIEDGEYNGDGFIQSVPTAGGPLVDVTGSLDQLANLQRYAGGYLVYDGANLYYARPIFPDSTIVFPDLVARRAAGGGETVIPNPLAGAKSMTITAIAAGSPGNAGVAWVVYDENASTAWALHWDGAPTQVLGQLDDIGTRAFFVGTTVYIAGVKQLWSSEIGGAAGVHTLRTWGQGGELLAANSTSLFFTPDGSTVVRLDVLPTGPETTLATGLKLSQNDFAYADEANLYVATESGILRIPVAGGPSTVFTTDRTGYALAGDDCNLYWAVPNQSFQGDALVMAKAK